MRNMHWKRILVHKNISFLKEKYQENLSNGGKT